MARNVWGSASLPPASYWSFQRPSTIASASASARHLRRPDLRHGVRRADCFKAWCVLLLRGMANAVVASFCRLVVWVVVRVFDDVGLGHAALNRLDITGKVCASAKYQDLRADTKAAGSADLDPSDRRADGRGGAQRAQGPAVWLGPECAEIPGQSTRELPAVP